MKALLINPKRTFKSGSQTIYPPIGLMTVAGSIEGMADIEVLDIQASQFTEPEIEREIKKKKFDIAAMPGEMDTFPYISWLSGVIREKHPSALIVGGGAFATVCPEVYLEQAGFDLVVVGEAELTFPDLVATIETGGNLENVSGIVYREGQEIVTTSPRLPIQHLDEFHAAYHLFSTGCYVKESDVRLKGLKQFTVLSSRGCPFKCAFCKQDYLGRAVRFKSIPRVIDEVGLLRKRYGVEAIHFADPTFTAHRQRTINLCRALDKVGLPWCCDTRVDCVDIELLNFMRKGGCQEITFGLESSNQIILYESHKGITLEQIRKALNNTKNNGIIPLVFVLFGLPGETEETITKTLEFVKEQRVWTIPNLLHPIPGTPIYQEAKAQGKLPSVPELLRKFAQYNLSDRTKPVVNLSQVSDERLADAIREVWRLNLLIT